MSELTPIELAHLTPSDLDRYVRGEPLASDARLGEGRLDFAKAAGDAQPVSLMPRPSSQAVRSAAKAPDSAQMRQAALAASWGAAQGNNVPDDVREALAEQGMDFKLPFSPGMPLSPYFSYGAPPKTWGIPVGYNIVTRPDRKRINFQTLESVIDRYDVARICIQHRIDDIRSLGFELTAQEGVVDDVANEIAIARQKLRYPDGKRPFVQWCAIVLENLLRYDAPSLYRMRNRKGDVIGLRNVDGTSIAPVLDFEGEPPDSPAPAYVQFVYGIPWGWHDVQALSYVPHRPQPNSPYGMPPMEFMLLNANTDLRFQYHLLQFFTEGNVPAGFMEAPPDRDDPDALAEWQEMWDAVMMGDQSKLRQIRWVPSGSKFDPFHPDSGFDEKFVLHMLGRTCAAFGVTPNDLGFTLDVNKSLGETQVDIQFRIGTKPTVEWLELIINSWLQEDLKLRVEIHFDVGQEKEDRLQEAQLWDAYVKMGAASPDEPREKVLGLPVDKDNPIPRFIFSTRAGAIPLKSLMEIAGELDPETQVPTLGSITPADDVAGFVSPTGVVPQPDDLKSKRAANAAGSGGAGPGLPAGETAATANNEPAATGAVAKAAADGLDSIIHDSVLSLGWEVLVREFDEETATQLMSEALIAKATTLGITSATGVAGFDGLGVKPNVPTEDVETQMCCDGRTAAEHRHVDGKCCIDDNSVAVVKAAEPTVAGMAVKAADTGRVLMLQRSLADDDSDPAAGQWEFPGGHADDSEDLFDAAQREWQEECGIDLPDGDLISSSDSADGVYRLHVYVTPNEFDVAGADRDADPDGDGCESLAWWSPTDAMAMPALRREAVSSDWQSIIAAQSADIMKAVRQWRDNSRTRVRRGLKPKRFEDVPETIAAIIWPTLEHAADRRAVDEAFAKAGGVDPKGEARWAHHPAGKQAHVIVEHYAALIADALKQLWPRAKLHSAVKKLAAENVKKAAGDETKTSVNQGVIDDLAQALGSPDLSALQAAVTALYQESYAAAGMAAQQQLGGGAVLAGNLGETSAEFNWDNWQPGDAEAAAKVEGPGLRDLLDSEGLTNALTDMSDSQLSRIGNALADGLSAGDSPDDIADSIDDVVGSDARSFMIADTETARAMTAAAVDSYTANGVEEGDLITADGACPVCEAIADSNPHPVDDAEAQPPIHPYCRCAFAPVVPKGGITPQSEE